MNRLNELMKSKDKLRREAEKPFQTREMQGNTHLRYPQFSECIRHFLEGLEVPVPAEKQLEALFKKFRNNNSTGITVEDYEALIFRLLCFMVASGEVKNPGKSAGGEERDKKWREEFLKKNQRRFDEVYEWGKKLGEGSFGCVYLVQHRAEMAGARRPRVSKVISKSKADQQGTPHERVREEFAVLKKLDHPHVVRIFEDFEDDKNFYLVMEQCKGGDLQDAVLHPSTRDPVEWEWWVSKVIQQTLGAVSYCHSKGVIHKDLKPENVMMTSEKKSRIQDVHAVVVDYGLAEMFRSEFDRSKEVAGTPPFMAPEVWAGNFSKSCDVWSVGVMLFFMLSGQLPFMAQRLQDFPQAVRRDPRWADIGGASSQAQMMCFRMLHRSEAERPTAQELLKDKWFDRFSDFNGTAPKVLPSVQFKGLMQVNERSDFEKFMARLVATQVDAGQQSKINEAFRALDTDKDGTLSCVELKRGLVLLGASSAEAEKVVRELDVGKTGVISYTEFLAGVMDLRRKSPHERDELLWLAWQQFQPNSRGLVQKSAIQEQLAARGLTVADLPQSFLSQLRQGRADGFMSFDEFKKLLLVDESFSLLKSFCVR
uniref:non-specific serine/threonine protein kinase n=1 Tax=Noctiluca scintillans TaxID=2966 RepID=A0A7S1F6F9_NOCSC